MPDPFTVIAGKAVPPVIKALPARKLWRWVRRQPPISAHVEFDLLRQNSTSPSASMTYPMYLPVNVDELHKITAEDSPGIGEGLVVVELPRWAARYGGCSAHYQRIVVDIVCAKDAEVDILAYRAEATKWEPPDGVVVDMRAGGSATKIRALQVTLDARHCIVADLDPARVFEPRRTRLDANHDTLILDIFAAPLQFGSTGSDRPAVKGYEWEFIVEYREVGKVGDKNIKELRLPGRGKKYKVLPGKAEKFKIVNGNVFPEFVADRETDQWIRSTYPSAPTFPKTYSLPTEARGDQPQA
ncbi:Uncharacterised protein [Mycobacteroides abscessus subsp. bolletii]|uniref:hypothetical protein n=1 Tax=Mycobacteroides abscessus TaxID=36809 RepID=UPI0009A7F11E|nr:hypothetical protein [Mycobacteroides abscessus]SKU75473.1 Uncharacterised protein [Mycobacteroides abscessus subsp. bolletii]